jgi:hypothetical protein
MENNKFTTQDYWENYYAKSSTDRDMIVKICGKFDSLWDELYSIVMLLPNQLSK